MSYDEFVKWHLYFEESPPGWQADYRASRIIAAQGVTTPAREIFPSIGVIQDVIAKREEERAKQDSVNLNSLKGTKFLTQLLNATGGEKLSILGQL